MQNAVGKESHGEARQILLTFLAPHRTLDEFSYSRLRYQHMRQTTNGLGEPPSTEEASANWQQAAAPSLSDRLDFPTAWRRMKADRPDRTFVVHPFLIQVIDQDVVGWFSTLRFRTSSRMLPYECTVLDVPKPNWLVRPAHLLNLEDELVYTAILGAFHSQIWQRLEWSQGGVDLAYRLAKPSKAANWVKTGFTVWADWRVKSLAKLSEGCLFMLTTDVTGFYENIDHHRLTNDLRAVNADEDLVNGLAACLGRWAAPRDKGIPQGYTASDILAKLYMDPIDRGMASAGYSYLRYVDDIRVFCKSMLEAKRALIHLNDLIRNRGLNLQSAKTMILSVEEARSEIDGVDPIIRAIGQQMAMELSEVSSFATYGTLKDLDRYLERNPDAPPPAVLERAFTEHFISVSGNFNKTVFHYLLTRLGRARSTIAVDYSLQQLATRPEETKAVLKYLAALPRNEEVQKKILSYMESAEAIYDYQTYEILRWFYGGEPYPERLLHLCRRWAFDLNRPACLRSYARAILGDAARPEDLDQLERECVRATDTFEKVDYLVALYRMETIRRNTLFGRHKNEIFLVQKAIQYAKKHSHLLCEARAHAAETTDFPLPTE